MIVLLCELSDSPFLLTVTCRCKNNTVFIRKGILDKYRALPDDLSSFFHYLCSYDGIQQYSKLRGVSSQEFFIPINKEKYIVLDAIADALLGILGHYQYTVTEKDLSKNGKYIEIM